MNISSDDDEIRHDDDDSKIEEYAAKSDLCNSNWTAFSNDIGKNYGFYGVLSQIWWGSRQNAGVLASLTSEKAT